jgi:hypothetical protein
VHATAELTFRGAAVVAALPAWVPIQILMSNAVKGARPHSRDVNRWGPAGSPLGFSEFGRLAMWRPPRPFDRPTLEAIEPTRGRRVAGYNQWQKSALIHTTNTKVALI